MEDSESKSKKIADFLQTVLSTGGLDLKFNINTCNEQVQPNAGDPAGALPPSSSSAAQICVEFSGPDTQLLLARNGELLLALEHLAAKVLRFEHEEHDRISFDAENFKVLRRQELHLAAEAAIERVLATGRPYSFAPMTSRERRILHMALAPSGLPTASSGDGPRRFVVLYPHDQKPEQPPPAADRVRAIRNTFRRR